MPPQGLTPGERVVNLSGLAISAAVVTSGVSSAWIVWVFRNNWLTSVGAAIAGAIAGFITARVVAEFVYHTPDGRITVVKAGGTSLSATIRAGLAGSMPASVVVAILGLVLFGASNHVAVLIGVPLGCSVLIGVVFACLASLS